MLLKRNKRLILFGKRKLRYIQEKGAENWRK
jgi:hypothetical protein